MARSAPLTFGVAATDTDYSADDGSANCACWDPVDADVKPGDRCGSGSGRAEAGRWVARGGLCWYEYPCVVDTRCSCYETDGDRYFVVNHAGGTVCSGVAGAGTCKGADAKVKCRYDSSESGCVCTLECWGADSWGGCVQVGKGTTIPIAECASDASDPGYTMEQGEFPAGGCPGRVAMSEGGVPWEPLDDEFCQIGVGWENSAYPHSYVVITYPNGWSYQIDGNTGDPSEACPGTFGCIQVNRRNIISAVGAPVSVVYSHHAGTCVEANDMLKAAEVIRDANIPYNPIFQNSNSVTRTLLQFAGLDADEAPMWGLVGWGNYLL